MSEARPAAEEPGAPEAQLRRFLPRSIARRLAGGERFIAEQHEAATVVYCSIHQFERLSQRMQPRNAIGLLDEVFSRFDELAAQLGLERLRTYGPAWLAAAGVPQRRDDHVKAAGDLALRMLRESSQFDPGGRRPLLLRIGLDSGPVVSGLIGSQRMAYDIWGQTVETAHAMEATAPPGSAQVTQAVFDGLRSEFIFESRGTFFVHGSGDVRCYLLAGRQGARPNE